MSFKKGFTLAEILIVLMVIGVIATLTIPSLMKGVTEAQYKTAYKKAYNVVVNVAAMEKIAGSLPTNSGDDQVTKFWEALNSSLSVKEYAINTANSGATYGANVYYSGVSFTNSNGYNQFVGTSSGNIVSAGYPTVSGSVWIITDDNLAYAVYGKSSAHSGSDCGTVSEINSKSSHSDIMNVACGYVLVDVNGLGKGPNRVEQQQLNSGKNMATSQLSQLTGDRYYIYLGMDGATAGSKRDIVGGRIVADLK